MGIKSFHSKVAGVSKKNPDGMERQKYIKRYCKPGQMLFLKPEPDNPYDPNAFAVWIKTRVLVFSSEVQIGYLNKQVAREVAEHIGAGGKARAKISNITGGTRRKKTRGVNIEITLG